jgi:hypothetical protein
MPKKAKPPSGRAGPEALLIRIEALEASRGILVPGHRFEALRDEALLPWELCLEDGAGLRLGLRRIALSFADLCVFSRLFGIEDLPRLLVLDDPENLKALRSADPRSDDFLVRARVFDLAALYARESLVAGDYLRVTRAEEGGRRFALTGLKAGAIDGEERRLWFAGMEKGFRAAMKELKLPADNSLLLRRAYSLAPWAARTAPAASLSEFVDEAGVVELKAFAGRHLLWSAGYSPLTADLPPPTAEPDASELDRSLADLEISLGEDEFEAFVRDELFAGRPALGATVRCFGDLDELGYPSAQLARLRRLADAKAAEVERLYNPALDRRTGPLRATLLPLYERFIFWMRDSARAGLLPEDLPEEAFSDLAGLMAGICDLVFALNRPEDFGREGMARLLEDSEGLGLAVDELMAELPVLDLPPRRAARTGAAKAGAAERAGEGPRGKPRPLSQRTFILGCRLAGVEPPVTRQLAVPGNRSLAELDEILRAAFGWPEDRSHVFTIKGESYALPAADGKPGTRDEGHFRLDGLGLRARSRFTYEYDRSGPWIHDLLVLQGSKNLADIDLPLLLGGEGSAPPENCGGPSGYAALIAAQGPRQEGFDLDATRAALARLG